MTEKVIVDEQSLRDFFATNPRVSGRMNSDDVDAFLREARFEDGQLTSMRYVELMIKLSINEFLEFLDAAAIPREAFLDGRGRGCGKNYSGSKGNCSKNDGNYCYCD